MPKMDLIDHEGALSEETIKRLFQLWNSEYPVSIAHDNVNDFKNYLNNLEQVRHRFITFEGIVVGWQFRFLRSGNRWFGMMVDSKWQGNGLGRKLLKQLQKDENEIFGWVVTKGDYVKADGSLYRSPLVFYTKHDFKVMEEEVMKTDRLETVKIYWRKDEE